MELVTLSSILLFVLAFTSTFPLLLRCGFRMELSLHSLFFTLIYYQSRIDLCWLIAQQIRLNPHPTCRYVVIWGTIACNVNLAILEPLMIGEPADPFATALNLLSSLSALLYLFLLRHEFENLNSKIFYLMFEVDFFVYALFKFINDWDATL